MTVTKRSDDLLELVLEEARLNTFAGKWKSRKGFKHCNPANFAAAGFYYVGTKASPDAVKCFACCKELSDWEKDDDPWKEHIKRGKNCAFVQMKMKEVVTVEDFIRFAFEVVKNKFNEVIETQKKQLMETCESVAEA